MLLCFHCLKSLISSICESVGEPLFWNSFVPFMYLKIQSSFDFFFHFAEFNPLYPNAPVYIDKQFYNFSFTYFKWWISYLWQAFYNKLWLAPILTVSSPSLSLPHLAYYSLGIFLYFSSNMQDSCRSMIATVWSLLNTVPSSSQLAM